MKLPREKRSGKKSRRLSTGQTPPQIPVLVALHEAIADADAGRVEDARRFFNRLRAQRKRAK